MPSDRLGNARPGFRNRRISCYLYDRLSPLSAGDSDNRRTPRGVELKPVDFDAKTPGERIECSDFGMVSEWEGLGAFLLDCRTVAKEMVFTLTTMHQLIDYTSIREFRVR